MGIMPGCMRRSLRIEACDFVMEIQSLRYPAGLSEVRHKPIRGGSTAALYGRRRPRRAQPDNAVE